MYQIDWILFVELFLVEPPLGKILDGVSIRFFVLKIIFQILMDLRGVHDQAATAWVRRLDFCGIPIFWSCLSEPRVEEHC